MNSMEGLCTVGVGKKGATRRNKELFRYASGFCLLIVVALVVWSGSMLGAVSYSVSDASPTSALSTKELESLIEHLKEEIAVSESLLQRLLSPNEGGRVSAIARAEVRQALLGSHKDVAAFLRSPDFASRAAAVAMKVQEEGGSIAASAPSENSLSSNTEDATVRTDKLGQSSVTPGKSFRITEELLRGNVANAVSTLPPTLVSSSHGGKTSSSSPPVSTAFVQPAVIPEAVEFGDRAQGSVLVVGGTDGSGTRRVVEVLTLLGVTMVSEDPETLDIHADLVGGWPDIIRPVVQAARSTSYDHDVDLPWKVRKDTVQKMQNLLRLAEDDARRPQSKILSIGGRLDTPRGVRADGVSFGIKAPVAMTVVPSWRATVPNLKFLHVVRDGRDIAFSTNQAPVEKFYYTMYGRSKKETNIRTQAIELWSDWNSALFEWSKNVSMHPNPEHKYGYFLIHIEDLVSDSTTIQFSAMRRLADWVGSNASDEYLCCLAVAGPSFLGPHERGVWRKSGVLVTNEVRKKYGKWRERTKLNLGLAESLTQSGRTGLETLGYEPLRPLPAYNAYTSSGFTCNLTPNDCGIVEAPRTVATCKYYPMTNYNGIKSLNSGSVLAKSLDDCCQLCADFGMPMCVHFTYDTTSKTCYFKKAKGDIIEGESVRHLISGNVSPP